jgi:hypothetical protein
MQLMLDHTSLLCAQRMFKQATAAAVVVTAAVVLHTAAAVQSCSRDAARLLKLTQFQVALHYVYTHYLHRRC